MKGEEGDGRAEVLSAIGDERKAAVSLTRLMLMAQVLVPYWTQLYLPS